MKINRRTLEYYNALFISFIDAPPLIKNNYQKRDMFMISLGQEITQKERILKLFFDNENSLSKFVAEIKDGCTIEYDGFIYKSYLYELSNYGHIGNGLYEPQFVFSVVKMKKPEVYKLTSSISNVQVNATYKSPVIYYIVAKENIDLLSINGTVIESVMAGDRIELNGYNQTVKRNGENNFANVTLKDNIFPFFTPGVNKVKIELIDKLDVSIKVYPIWI